MLCDCLFPTLNSYLQYDLERRAPGAYRQYEHSEWDEFEGVQPIEIRPEPGRRRLTEEAIRGQPIRMPAVSFVPWTAAWIFSNPDLSWIPAMRALPQLQADACLFWILLSIQVARNAAAP